MNSAVRRDPCFGVVRFGRKVPREVLFAPALETRSTLVTLFKFLSTRAPKCGFSQNPGGITTMGR